MPRLLGRAREDKELDGLPVDLDAAQRAVRRDADDYMMMKMTLPHCGYQMDSLALYLNLGALARLMGASRHTLSIVTDRQCRSSEQPVAHSCCARQLIVNRLLLKT